ncbi:Nonribosomal peptide synthase [Hyphodiscus hymeniophilus]|uniref:Nonribosomal peptide synthase n=1 Tax=Hyphodiscus hymeniophilus TaxID=353542 RepID=A0A9P6VCJ8_9HELO|nr:Nonribosomal peptide synthase [Hyphodiscus hymeniophilus]
MGSIHVSGDHTQIHQPTGLVDVFSKGQTDQDGYMSFNIVGLAADQTITSTGMREELLFLSWLLVLLRTREGRQISFNWTYKSQENGLEYEPARRCLSLDEFVTRSGSSNLVGQVAAAISDYITALTPCQSAAMPTPASLLLNTSFESQSLGEEKDERALQLEIGYAQGLLKIRVVRSPENMPQFTVNQHVETLVDTIETCISNPSSPIEDFTQPTPRDLDKIWGWNHMLPPSYNFCMHEMISEQSQRYSDKVAVSSWDGSLTYRQIEQYSTFIACLLKKSGVVLHDIIPVCFEKSRWTIVAVLAVMKVGATFVLMDPTLPLARLENMAKQVSATTMVTSLKQHELSTLIIPDGKIVTVESDIFTPFLDSEVASKLTAVPPSALMYIIFTSGSTGTPKGVCISHETYTSSAIPRAKAVGYAENSRVLDFASYAFDVSIDSMLLTLGSGGCLCIPSDEDRMNDINGAMRKMEVNYAGLTPSVARILDPDVIASLGGLGLGGEAVSASDVALWGRETRIVIGYGPCECTIGCTINSSAATGRDYISIGRGNGAAIWVVDPNDHDSLMPVGAVGELLVEGPIVGQGYLNDPDKTAAAFIKDPPWLIAGHKSYIGRRGRLYKTGDLGKYDPDGSGGIVFVGRQDTQVKLRGQRVELSEIESQLRARLPSDVIVISEVITPLGSGGQPTLVAFIASRSRKRQEDTDLKLIQLPIDLCSALSKADADLGDVLPRYMVPTAYIPANYIPALISGKTDRKKLRLFGATVDLRELGRGTTSTTSRQLSDIERRLRQAWGQTLKLDPETIHLEDNFFALGGDSLTAMRLMSVCRSQNLDLTVIGAFNHPTLSAMAGVVQICSPKIQAETPAFSMISQTSDSACLEASRICGSDRVAIEDIHPCTPTQESLFTFSVRSVKAYVAQRIACIPSHVSLDVWKKAWDVVVASSPILRTRLAQLQEPGLQQVVLKEPISWVYSTDLVQYLHNDRNEKMDLGQSLARYAIVDDSKDGKRYMVWTVHHVLYDGWSEPLILKNISKALESQHMDTQAQMKDFVKYVRDIDDISMQEFWRHELKGAVGPQFPRLPSRDYSPTVDAMLEHQIDLDTTTGSPFTMATLIRGAWALVASQHTGSDDVVFGETLTGRDIPLPGVEDIVGPLIATIPVRVQIQRTTSVEHYLQNVQQGILARTPYQHMGMQNIRKVSQDAQYACEAGTGLVIQPEPKYVGSELGFDAGDVVREALHFNPYPLMLACGIREGGFRVCASFDSSLITVTQMGRILAQLETACSQLAKGLSRRLDEISCLPGVELNQVWRWNQTPPLSLDESSQRLRAVKLTKQGSIYPPAVVSWVCDPRTPSLLSPIGCVGELWLEGALLPGETFEAPAWLRAGSSDFVGRTGRVQPTGDMVQLQENGNLLFVGRKENILSVEGGHVMDVADLEVHFTSFLAPKTIAAAAIFKPSLAGTQQIPQQELVVFIEQEPCENGTLELMPAKYDIICETPDVQAFETTICDTIPITLAASLKRLDKFLEDSLPSYMVPSTYVVIDKIPTGMGQVDHILLNRLASMIPQAVLDQLREGFKEAWTNNLTQTELTDAESILQSSWAKVLGIAPGQIDLEDNFFRLGGDSVLAMKLVSILRAQGHSLTVSDIFQHMRLGDAAKVFKVNYLAEEKSQPYKAFSMLGQLDVEKFLSEIVRPKLANTSWSIQDVFPVTDSQAFDVRSTIQQPRTSIQYTMLYLDKDIDRERLYRAWSELVKTHEILRAVFIEHESKLFQVVINDLIAPVTTYLADKRLEQYATDLCLLDIESDFQLGTPFCDISHTESDDGQQCLAIRLSHAQYDGISLPRLLQDLGTLYTGGEIVDYEPFSRYMARIYHEQPQKRAINYWTELLNGSSLSVLEGNSVRPGDKSIFQSKTVDITQRPKETTIASLLTAAWSLVLARRLRRLDVTFGAVTLGRNLDLANVENVIGPCYQFTPIRVIFDAQWKATDLLYFVQQQSAASAAHDFLGFERISKECTEWPSEARFFDSMVHHQDFDDFDTMPFAGGNCKVEILNPHGDAAFPLKAVSFVQSGETHVGIVGRERDSAFVHAILEELVGSIQELVIGGEEHRLLDGQIF